MAKTLDFNVYEPPALHLVMCDAERTEIDVIPPNEGLIEELCAVGPGLLEGLNTKDDTVIPHLYDLCARLINCNKQGIHVTALDLRDKYKLNWEMLALFITAYQELLGEISNAKN